MENTPTIQKTAYVIAFVFAGLVFIGGIFGPLVLAPAALIPMLAGLGIMRRRVWSAYGFALYIFVQIFFLCALLFWRGNAQGTANVLTSAVFYLLLGLVFIAAGRSLSRAGAAKGSPLTWIAISSLTTLPLLFVEPFVIPTGAMEDTLLIGDRLFVTLSGSSPSRGDMVVFRYPVDPKQTFGKRVVGVAGDRIRFSNKQLYRNGQMMAEPYATHKLDYTDSYRDNFPSEPNAPLFPSAQDMLSKHVVNGEVIVPDGKYFVLGDNRDQSLDSRYWGFVSQTDLIGKPWFIYDSAQQSTDDIANGQFWRRHTRWERLFKVL